MPRRFNITRILPQGCEGALSLPVTLLEDTLPRYAHLHAPELGGDNEYSTTFGRVICETQLGRFLHYRGEAARKVLDRGGVPTMLLNRNLWNS